MKKLGFVVPWYGENIPGGAEMLLRGLTSHMAASGVELEILTTCVKQFTSDWNENYHKEGVTTEGGITIRRFKVRKRDSAAFDRVNAMLIKGRKPSREDQEVFVREMVNSTDLYDYMSEHKDEYSWFLYTPYMFGTTINGIRVAPEKSVLIPCFHDEAYAYMDVFTEEYKKIKGMVFNAVPEEELALRIYDLTNVKHKTIGVGLDTKISSDPQRFREKFNIHDPFILYAGRKDEGKNVHTLVKFFAEFKKRNSTNLKLVLIGGGQMDFPEEFIKSGDIIDLGFVDIQDKYDANSAALLLCQPSKNESFSLVIMESWLGGRPVMVHEDCEVTKHFVVDANGGFYFKTYYEFEGQVNYLMNNPDVASKMGANGCEYVKARFDWDIIVKNYMDFLNSCE
ncbi:MAG: glycosyltransferase family 4 protein [Clostridia bacterium]|nr:glycosyltransferase family 4 protein [Clostridia bacterium]